MDASQLIEVSGGDWRGEGFSIPRENLLAELETGGVLYFPNLRFMFDEEETFLFNPACADPAHKNISLAADAGALLQEKADSASSASPRGLPLGPAARCATALNGVRGAAALQAALRALLTRYQRCAATLIKGLAPAYAAWLRVGPTSLRLHRVETRAASWRKDDGRLHVDAFASRPNRGARILRVFANIHPAREPRVWRIGEPFEQVARRFLPKLRPPLAGSSWLLAALRITKSRRSEYDHLMLRLHDAMKFDAAYQRDCPQRTVAFAAGSAWVCFSDQTSHAAMSGQFMLEQSFFLPVKAMMHPERSPLYVLSQLAGRALV